MKRRVHGAVWACLAFIAAACTSRGSDSFGQQCVFNGECAAGFSCFAGYCRAACSGPRDCTSGTCIPRAGGGAVCVPNSAPRECLLRTECGANELCSPSGRCVAECKEDYDCALYRPGTACLAMGNAKACLVPDAGMPVMDVPDVIEPDVVEMDASDAGNADDVADVVDAPDVILEPPPPVTNGLVGWYDARDTAITTDGSNNVLTWPSRIGNITLTAYNGGAQVAMSSVLPGRVLVFNGGALRTTGPVWDPVQNTILALVVQTSMADNDVVGTGDFWTNNDTLLMLISGRVGAHYWPMGRFTGVQQYGNTGSLPNNTPLLIGQAVDGLGMGLRVFLNGVEDATATWPEAAVRVPRALYIGRRCETCVGGGMFRGEIAEVLVYDRVLTDPERTQVENFIRGHWGLPLP